MIQVEHQKPQNEKQHPIRENATSVSKEKIEKAREDAAKKVQQQQQNRWAGFLPRAATRYAERVAVFIPYQSP